MDMLAHRARSLGSGIPSIVRRLHQAEWSRSSSPTEPPAAWLAGSVAWSLAQRAGGLPSWPRHRLVKILTAWHRHAALTSSSWPGSARHGPVRDSAWPSPSTASRAGPPQSSYGFVYIRPNAKCSDNAKVCRNSGIFISSYIYSSRRKLNLCTN